MEVLRRALCRDGRLRIICLKMFLFVDADDEIKPLTPDPGLTSEALAMLPHKVKDPGASSSTSSASSSTTSSPSEQHVSQKVDPGSLICCISGRPSMTSSSSEQQEMEIHLPPDLLQDDRFTGKFSFNEVSMCLHIETEDRTAVWKRETSIVLFVSS